MQLPAIYIEYYFRYKSSEEYKYMIFAIYNGLLRESALVNSPKSSSRLDLEHDYYQRYNNNDKMIMTMIRQK